MATNISEEKLKGIVKESVREVFKTELMTLRALALPEVSEEEQSDIEKEHGAPSKEKGNDYPLEV